jgi:hypothetical protein
MATIPIINDLDITKQSILRAKWYPLTTAARTALILDPADEGILVFDTTLDRLLAWNGIAWGDATPQVAASVFRGGIAANAVAPVTPGNGDLYVFTSSGTTPISWTPQATVAAGDFVIWDQAATLWRYIEGNAVPASTANAGLIAIATGPETDSGIVSNKALTPALLAGYTPPSALTLRPTRRFAVSVPSLVANTPFTVTHGLALTDPSDVSASIFQGGRQILVSVVPVNVNSLTIESNVTLSNVRVVCVG